VIYHTARSRHGWHRQVLATRKTQPATVAALSNNGDREEMGETMQTAAAIILALTAALMSSAPQARQEVSSYLAAALAPQAADLGDALD
jgi:hypothetical protein